MISTTLTPGTLQAVKTLMAAEGKDFDQFMRGYHEYKRLCSSGEKTSWLRIREVMSQARVSRATVWRWIRGNRLKALKTSNMRSSRVMIDADSFERLLASMTISSDGGEKDGQDA